MISREAAWSSSKGLSSLAVHKSTACGFPPRPIGANLRIHLLTLRLGYGLSVERQRAIVLHAWVVLERAVVERRRVRLRYHGTERVVCPHVLGWKSGRAKALLYQVDGTTSQGLLPDDPRQRWRSMFVDEIEAATVVGGCWESAENFSVSSSCVDVVGVAVGEATASARLQVGELEEPAAGRFAQAWGHLPEVLHQP